MFKDPALQDTDYILRHTVGPLGSIYFKVRAISFDHC